MFGERTYLGDDVYVSYDGYYIRLSMTLYGVENHVDLEPEVFENLIDYVEKLTNHQR